MLVHGLIQGKNMITLYYINESHVLIACLSSYPDSPLVLSFDPNIGFCSSHTDG